VGLRIDAFGLSDAGCVREVNEDNCLCLDLSKDGVRPDPSFFLLAVADGIGGHAGGSVASALAVQTLRENIRPGDGFDPKARLTDSFLKANRLIYDQAVREPLLAGMGTTMTAAIVEGERIAAANVGDSRLYLLRDGDLSQVTEDHSWAAEQRRRSLLSESDIQRSPFRSMITRSLGYLEDVEVDTFALSAGAGDVLMFCTDGLHGLVPGKKIARILKKHPEPKAACFALIEAAKNAGGDDNITVVVARFEEIKNGQTIRLSDTVRLPPAREKC